MVNSSVRGSDTSTVEVTAQDRKGLTLLWNGKKLTLCFEDFPWFRDQPATAVRNVEQPTPGHFYWPDLDIDVSAEMIEHPERFPLKARLA